MAQPIYHRILLKLSGEVLAGRTGFGIDPKKASYLANEIKSVFEVGVSIGLIIAIASATQDITVDAIRIEQIGEHEGKSMQAGAAMAVVGWWTGYKLGGVIALNTAEFFQQYGFENYWLITFLILPPSKEVFFKRLSNRDMKDKLIVEERMKQFEHDVLQWINYDYVVINNNLNECYKKICSLIQAEIKNFSKDYDKNLIRKHVETLTS